MLKRVGKFAVLVAAIFTLAFTGTLSAQANLPGDVTLTFAHTNDMHGRIVESKDVIGFPRIYTAVQDLKAKNPNTILVDVGDTFHGLPVVNIDKGETAVKLMNELGYSYMTTGNHDYNYGFDRLMELSKMAKFEILAANVYKDGQRVFPAYDIRDMGGVRVAFFGLATPETAYKTDPKGIEGVTFGDPMSRPNSSSRTHRNMHLVCLSHSYRRFDRSHFDHAAKFVRDRHNLDDTATHARDIQKRTPRTLSSRVLVYGSALGVVDVVVVRTADHLQDARSLPHRILLTSGIQDCRMLDSHTKVKIRARASRRQMTWPRRQDGNRPHHRQPRHAHRPHSLVTAADIARMNGGGIRDSSPPDITMSRLHRHAFGNYIQTATQGSD